MDVTNPDAMAKFADDVRSQQEPFIRAAMEGFEKIVRQEYTRLRAHALEAGSADATLSVTMRCSFDPAARSVEFNSAPIAVPQRPRRVALRVA